MTRKDLEKVYYLKRELKMWEERLKELYADMAQDTIAPDGMPHSVTNNVGSPTESKAIQIADHIELIREHRDKIERAIREVEEFISGINDPGTRELVELRCVKCLSWKEVADSLEEGTTADCARQAYHRFLQTIEFE